MTPVRIPLKKCVNHAILYHIDQKLRPPSSGNLSKSTNLTVSGNGSKICFFKIFKIYLETFLDKHPKMPRKSPPAQTSRSKPYAKPSSRPAKQPANRPAPESTPVQPPAEKPKVKKEKWQPKVPAPSGWKSPFFRLLLVFWEYFLGFFLDFFLNSRQIKKKSWKNFLISLCF